LTFEIAAARTVLVLLAKTGHMRVKQLIESIGEAWTNKAIAEEASPGIDTDASLSLGS
jgi:hypothetical protein